MLNVKRFMASVAVFGVTLMLNVPAVLAQYDYTYDYGYTTTDSGAGWFGILISCCACIFAALMVGFQIWMLLHAIKHAPESEKTLWIILILLIPLASIIYFFTKRSEWEKLSKAGASNVVTSAPSAVQASTPQESK